MGLSQWPMAVISVVTSLCSTISLVNARASSPNGSDVGTAVRSGESLDARGQLMPATIDPVTYLLHLYAAYLNMQVHDY